ncbi:MAG: Fic family protein [archaeon]|nr:Fic family protein [archaeon]
MVYIYKKVASEKVYYYLRTSERKNGKVISKDVAYLGNNIESVKKALGKLPKYKKDIEKSYRTIHLFLESNHFLEKAKKLKLKTNDFLESTLFEVEACKLHFTTVFKNFDSLTQEQMMNGFLIEYAVNTTSIEGNTITLKEAYNLLEDGLTPKGKTLREIYDLQNTKKVFEKLDFKKDISHDLIKNIHADLLENIDSRTEYRAKDIKIIHMKFKASSFYLVSKDLDLLIRWYKQNKKKMHSFVLAVLFHHKFEKIHPFFDGNGRTGRMLMNFILLKSNYPPLIIQNKHRFEYLDALNTADTPFINQTEKKDYKKLVQFAATELNETYWNNFL